MAAATQQAQLTKDAVTQIAYVSTKLREAIGAAIPVAPDQYLTISIPGNVIDIRTPAEGGSYIYDATQPFVPTSVRQEEARLVDKMMPLANIMVGNTGKSVSRSYSRALDGLVPRKATVKSGVNVIRSPGEQGYDDAMTYLTTVDPTTGLTPVDVYIGKQKVWANCQDDWDQAKIDAKKAASTDIANYGGDGKPNSVKVLQAYNDWTQANYRKYKFAVQGAWMDWVANGHKYDVEYNFGMVDIDSIMARVENSKESMRNSTMADSDGANELQGVILTPRDWATKCKQKADGWFARNGAYSVDQLDAEIARLTRLQWSYQALKEVTVPDISDPPPSPLPKQVYPVTYPEEGGTAPTGTDDATVAKAYQTLYKAEGTMNQFREKIRNDPATAETTKSSADYTKAVTALATAQNDLSSAIAKNKELHAELAKFSVTQMGGDSAASLKTWIQNMIDTITAQIRTLNQKRDAKLGADKITLPVIATVSSDPEDPATVSAPAGSEKANALFDDPPPAGTPSGSVSDPWTTITASFSALSQSASTNTSSWGMSVGGGAGWGLWSVGGSYAHEQSKSDSVSDMASCDVSVSFSALVVNIDRPWLYAELFNDFELDVAEHIKLSPGAMNMKQMMAAQADSADGIPTEAAERAIAYLAQYNSFPAFPTSFLLAADTTIEFTGNTSHIEDHFSAEANSGSLSVGWGPFCVSSSFHQSSSQSSHQMQTTATGCKLTFGAPQIIGWVSQIIPELPRSQSFEPMVQNLVPAGVLPAVPG